MSGGKSGMSRRSFLRGATAATTMVTTLGLSEVASADPEKPQAFAQRQPSEEPLADRENMTAAESSEPLDEWPEMTRSERWLRNSSNISLEQPYEDLVGVRQYIIEVAGFTEEILLGWSVDKVPDYLGFSILSNAVDYLVLLKLREIEDLMGKKSSNAAHGNPTTAKQREEFYRDQPVRVLEALPQFPKDFYHAALEECLLRGLAIAGQRRLQRLGRPTFSYDLLAGLGSTLVFTLLHNIYSEDGSSRFSTDHFFVGAFTSGSIFYGAARFSGADTATLTHTVVNTLYEPRMSAAVKRWGI